MKIVYAQAVARYLPRTETGMVHHNKGKEMNSLCMP
jgi:hypothetical protein